MQPLDKRDASSIAAGAQFGWSWKLPLQYLEESPSSCLQATLAPDTPAGQKAAVKCKVGDDEIFICSLREGAQESTSLDLAFDSYTEFHLVGGAEAKVHLAGYIMPEYSEEESDEDDDEDTDDGNFNL